MASSNAIYRGYIAILFGMTFNAVECTAAEVHQQGNSTSVIRQSGGSGPRTTEVVKTPDGQKIITRDGRNTDITIQSSGDSGSRRSSGSGATQPSIDQDRFTRRLQDRVDDPRASKTNEPDSGISTAREFRQSEGRDPDKIGAVKTPDDPDNTTQYSAIPPGRESSGNATLPIGRDRFTHGSQDYTDYCPSTRRTSNGGTDFPTANEFEDRMRSRMRPLFPRP